MKEKALLPVLTEALAPFQPRFSEALDELVVTIEPQHLVEACRLLKEDDRFTLDYLRCLSVVDYRDSLEVVYHLWSMGKRHKLVLKTRCPTADPKVPSVVSVWRAADWLEREGHDLFGIRFEGHPNLKPLLLYEGFEGFPGRKDYPFYDYQEW